jgi:hypothetical protein
MSALGKSVGRIVRHVLGVYYDGLCDLSVQNPVSRFVPAGRAGGAG